MSRVAIAFVAFAAALLFSSGARAWDEIQSGVAKEAPECVSWAQGRVDCLARNASGRLTWVYLENGKWSPASDLGGNLAGPPSCVVRGPHGLNCFATSAKGVLATIDLNGATWGKWASLGGELIPARVSCVLTARDRIACFARGRRGQLMVRRWSGAKTWDPWRDLGGALSDDPECLVVGGANAACFARAASGELIAYLPDATGKSGGWASLGGRIEGRPSCVRLKSGEAACVAQSRSGRLYMWRGMALFAGAAGITTSSDDATADEPACALEGGALVCFTRNIQRRLVRRTLSSNADTARDGTLGSPAVAAVTCLSLGADSIGCVVTDNERNLHFASGQQLAAGTVEMPSTAADEEARGGWYLTNLGTSVMCRVHLSSELAFGAKRLRFGPRCAGVGLPARPVQWDQDDDALLFLAADGQVIARFRSTQAGRWISPRRDAALLLTREPPETVGETAALAEPPPPVAPVPRDNAGGAPGFSNEMIGPWRVFTDRAGFVCTIKLTNRPEGSAYAALMDPACNEALPGVAYWDDNGLALVLLGSGDRVVARFDSAGPGKWRARSLGGVTLMR